MMRSKYGAKQIIDSKGRRHDSKAEFRRCYELELLERAGEIRDLKRQVKHELIPAQYDSSGKLLEKAVCYISDFEYIDNRTGECVVEDVKGMKTKDYIIKRKLMLWIYKIRIKEVSGYK
jgi:hypothetical protein